MLTCVILFIMWYGEVGSSSKRFIQIDLAHVHTCKRLKIQSVMPWRFTVLRIIVSLICSIYYLILSQSMIMAVVLSIGRFQSFASLHLYWVWSLLVHPTPKNQNMPMVSTIPTYMWYFIATPKWIACVLPLKHSKKLLLALCNL